MSPAASPLGNGRRWVLYLRQSKKAPGSSIDESFSLAEQEQVCMEHLRQFDAEPASVQIIEEQRSARYGSQRPGFEELIGMIKAGKVDAICAFQVSRLGRAVESVERLLNICAQHEVFVTTRNVPDMTNTLVRTIYAGIAQDFVQERSAWSLASIQRRRRQGKPPCKTGIAYGLAWDGDRLVRDPQEWPVVQRIFDLFDRGMTMGKIARTLTKEGAPRRGLDPQWSSSAVSQRLRCSWYIGQIPDKDSFWDAGECFISHEQWERVQARLRARKTSKQNLDHVLSGLLFCAACGSSSPMSLCYSRHTRTDGTVLTSYRYRCMRALQDPDSCPGCSIAADKVEAFLLEQLRAVLGGDDIAKARFARRERQAAQQVSQEAERTAQEIEQLRDRQRGLFDRRTRGEYIVDAIFNDQMRRWDAQIDLLSQRREHALDRSTLARQSMQRAKEEVFGSDPLTEEVWFGLAAARRNEFLRWRFPNGLLVSPATRRPDKSPVEERLRVRTVDQASGSCVRAASQQRSA